MPALRYTGKAGRIWGQLGKPEFQKATSQQVESCARRASLAGQLLFGTAVGVT